MAKGHAVLVRLNEDTFKEFEHWRVKLGQSKSGFATMCVRAGIKSVVRGVEPESAMEPKVMAEVIGLLMKANRLDVRKVLKRKVKR